MASPAEFLRLPYTPDLTQGGITYAVRSLHYTYDRMGGSTFSRLRRIVGGVAVELALRRHLNEQGIPFDVDGATPFTDPDNYDVRLGGHRCDLKSFLITRRRQIALLKHTPERLLSAPALVPADQAESATHSPQDLYLFAFLLGLNALAPDDIQKAVSAGQPTYLMHPLPRDWAQPSKWASLRPLSLKSEMDAELEVELGGQNEARDFITTTLRLPPLKKVTLPENFYSLSYIRAHEMPNARLGIHSPAQADIYIINPIDWGNIWLYGMDIWLVGWMTHEEFRRKAGIIPAGQRVFQYSETRVKNLALPVADLRSLPKLLEDVKAWENGRKTKDQRSRMD
jgi:hypothetical protein